MESIRTEVEKVEKAEKVKEVYITKYEYARLMAARVTELSKNSAPCIAQKPPDAVGGLLQIAEAEFLKGALPLNIARRLPSGAVELCGADTLRLVPNHSYVESQDFGGADVELAKREGDTEPLR